MRTAPIVVLLAILSSEAWAQTPKTREEEQAPEDPTPAPPSPCAIPKEDAFKDYGKQAPAQREVVYYRGALGLMGVDTFRPQSTMTLPDRSWMAAELRWETPHDDSAPLPTSGAIVHTMMGVRYERFRLTQELRVQDRVLVADTGIHTLSWRRYFYLTLMQKMIQFGTGGNFGLAWEFSTYIEHDQLSDSYTDFRRVNRMMLYPGVPFFVNWRPSPKLVVTGEGTITAFMTTTTITPVARLAFGAGITF